MTKTEHYQLNQWDAADQVKRIDFNADNAKLDAALAGLGRKAATAPDVLARKTLTAANAVFVLNFSQTAEYTALRLLFWGLAGRWGAGGILHLNGVTGAGSYYYKLSAEGGSQTQSYIPVSSSESAENGGGFVDFWLYPVGQHTLVRYHSLGVNSAALNVANVYGAGLNIPFSSLHQISITASGNVGDEAFQPGTKAILLALIELAHCGDMKVPFPGQKNPIGPVTYVRPDGVTVEAMTEADMDRLSNEFATAALFMKAAGYDGILIHGGHGFIFTQFLSPLTNTRDDIYGGEKLEDRVRFPLQVLKTIRAAVGEDFIIDVRLSASENVPGGITPEMTGEFCKMMEGIVDSAHISAGLYNDPIRTRQFSCMFDPHGCNAELAAIVKKYTSLPVGVVGGINSPEFSEKIIEDGMVDYVILGRQMFADPEFANKAKEGRADEIRRCLRCFNCFNGSPEEGYTDLPSAEERRKKLGACAINPKAKTKYDANILPLADVRKKVLIVGGGVAGMQAAITCCERGHTVVLAEKNDKLGGLLNFTDIDVDKEDLRNFKNLLVADVKRKGIDVRLNTEANEALIREIAPDAIILAVGSRPVTPPIPGIEKARQVLDIYEKGLIPGKKVIIVGGGLVGCEAALHLTKTGHDVTIIEMLHRVANDSYGNYRKALTLEMDKCGIQCFPETKCLEITEDSVRVAAKDGTERVLQADTVLYGLGMRSTSAEVLQAAAGDIPCYAIGDCVLPGKVEAATSTAFNTAMAI